MSHTLEEYLNVFCQTFNIDEDTAKTAEFNKIDAWDSVGHMGLICRLEDTFHIVIMPDDIFDFNSYEKGKEILAKYNVEFA